MVQEPQWKVLSAPARDLVLSLLQPDPERRATVKLALNHRWIKGAREDSILDGSVMEGWSEPGHVPMAPWMASRLHSNLNCALSIYLLLCLSIPLSIYCFSVVKSSLLLETEKHPVCI